MPLSKRKGVDGEHLARARREALRLDYERLTPGQRVEQAIVLSREVTQLASRREERS
jgi:hypothetical protein